MGGRIWQACQRAPRRPSLPKPSAYVPAPQGKDGESCFLALWGNNGRKKERTGKE